MYFSHKTSTNLYMCIYINVCMCVYNDQRLIHPTTQLINKLITSYNLIKKFRTAMKKLHNRTII